MNPSFSIYDFKKHQPMPEEQKLGLQEIYRSFCSYANKTLSEFFKLPVEIDLISLKQLSLAHYLRSLYAPSSLAFFTMHPLKGPCLMEVSSLITHPAINIMLGGDPHVPVFSHPMNSLELAVNRKFIDILLDQLYDAWKAYLNINLVINEILLNPQKIPHILFEESYSVAFFDFKWQSITGSMSIGLPCTGIQEISHCLPKIEVPKDETGDNFNLSSIDVTLKAVLGTTWIEHDDLHQLQLGDILRLDQEANSPISIAIDETTICEGVPGLNQNYKAVLIRS